LDKLQNDNITLFVLFMACSYSLICIIQPMHFAIQHAQHTWTPS